jgi:hypothetical protein
MTTKLEQLLEKKGILSRDLNMDTWYDEPVRNSNKYGTHPEHIISNKGTHFAASSDLSNGYAIMRDIAEAGLSKLTFSDAVTLVHNAFQNTTISPEVSYNFLCGGPRKVLSSLVGSMLFTDTAIHSVPGEGIYFQDHARTDEYNQPVFDKEELLRGIETKDPTIRFAEFGAELNIIQALCNSKKIENTFGEVIKLFPQELMLDGFNDLGRIVTRLAGLRIEGFGKYMLDFSKRHLTITNYPIRALGVTFGIKPKTKRK